MDISHLDSKSLASYIIAYKALGLNKEIAIECMNELSKRRNLGDEFEFENFIEQELEKLPKITPPQNISNIFSLIKQFKNHDK